MTRRLLLTASFALALALPVGVIAAAANPGHYWLTRLLVTAAMALALGVLGWHLFGGGGPWGPASGAGLASGQRSGRPPVAAREQQAEAAADRASAEALRDTKIIVAAVLLVVAFTGWVWDTSWVLVGVLVVAFGTQAVRQLMAARG